MSLRKIIGGMKQERVTLSQKELKRVKIISTLCNGSMSNSDAAAALRLSLRQTIRLKKKYIAQGDAGMIHGNRNRQPKHTIETEVRNSVLQLFQEKYSDFNFSHFTDMLNELEGVKISRASVARILTAAGIKSKKHTKRRAKLHRGRPRKEAAGMLWQTDATPFEWFGKGNGYYALHAYIDDATGIVTGAFFTVNECMRGYVEALKRGIVKYGLPMEIYSDRHAIFRTTKKLSEEEELKGGERPLSDFGKGLAELGIGQIYAKSSEAKGRVKRLWETLQDRLTAEMRLLGITDIETANKALPKLIAKHNKKFAVKAQQKPVYAPMIEPIDFELLFAHRDTRKTDHGGGISYNGNWYAPISVPSGSLLANRSVEVRETFSGKLYCVAGGVSIAMEKRPKPERKSKPKPAKQAAPSGSKAYKPAPDHPWRQYSATKAKKSGISSYTAAS